MGDGHRAVGLGAKPGGRLGPQRERWARVQRLAASPGSARALMTAYADIDVRPLLETIRAPSLVLHRTGDRMIAIDNARYLAEHLPDARFVELPGKDHFIWTQDPDRIVEEIEEFLTGTRTLPEPDRVLATVLFTDIVGSTEPRVDRRRQGVAPRPRPPRRARDPGGRRRPRPDREVDR